MSGERGFRGAMELTSWIATAVSSIAAIVFGLIALHTSGVSDDLSTKVSRLNEANAKLEGTVARDRGTIDELQDSAAGVQKQLDAKDDEISALKSQVPSPPSSGSTSTLHNSGSVRLSTNGDTIDLNSTRPNFGAGSADSFEPDTVVLETGGESGLTLGLSDISVLKVADGKATESACSSASGYATKYELDVDSVRDGRTCLRLQSERFATINVKATDHSSYVELAIQVWGDGS